MAKLVLVPLMVVVVAVGRNREDYVSMRPCWAISRPLYRTPPPGRMK